MSRETRPGGVSSQRRQQVEAIEAFVPGAEADTVSFVCREDDDRASFDFEEFENWMISGSLSPNTIRQRMQFARSRIEEWGTLDVPSHAVGAWLSDYTGWTSRTYLNHLRCAYAWMLETGQIQKDPTVRLRRSAEPRIKPNPISDELLERMIADADGDLLTWLLLGALAGMRVFEIAKIHGEDVTEGTVRIRGKGGETAFVDTHPVLWDVAQLYPRHGYWFPSPQAGREYVCEGTVGNQVRAHFRNYGIESGAAHRLRHSFVTNLSRAGVRPRVVQELARHRSLETTMRYDAVDLDERRRAIRLLMEPDPNEPVPVLSCRTCGCRCGGGGDGGDAR